MDPLWRFHSTLICSSGGRDDRDDGCGARARASCPCRDSGSRGPPAHSERCRSRRGGGNGSRSAKGRRRPERRGPWRRAEFPFASLPPTGAERTSVVSGTGGSVLVSSGGRGIIKKKTET